MNRTRIEQRNDLVLVIAGRDDQHRRGGHRPQHRQDSLPVEVGQAEVQQHHIGFDVGHHPQRLEPARDAVHDVTPLGHPAGQRATDRRVVLDQQQTGTPENNQVP